MHSVFLEVVFKQGLGSVRDRVNKDLVTDERLMKYVYLCFSKSLGYLTHFKAKF